MPEYDICIYGGTSSGVIAAYSAATQGRSVILIEPGKHLGGMSSGGLGETDIGNKTAITGIARDFYRRIGRYYHEPEKWTFEPHVAEEIFNEYIRSSGVTVVTGYRITNAEKAGTVVSGIRLEPVEAQGEERTITARVFIDCSYEGDLMARAGVSYAVGRESNDRYNETYNGVQLRDKHQFPDGVDPYRIKGDPDSGLLWGISEEKLLPAGSGDKKVQAYNFRLCMTDSAENRLPVKRPDDYDSSRYELLARLIDVSGDHDLWHYLSLGRMPNRKTDINNNGAFSTDMINMSWEYPEASYAVRQKIFDEHVAYTKGLLYFLGHDPRVPDEMRNEMLRWGYPKDEFTDNDHFTWQLYIREARRMIGEYVMTQHNCTGAVTADDPVGMAAYTMDSHNCERLVVSGMVKNEGDVQVGGFPPYHISYRSIVPKKEECTNLIVPVCLSATHIAYGSIRMEPVFMVLGQSAGEAAVMAVENQTAVQEISVDELIRKLKSDPLLTGKETE